MYNSIYPVNINYSHHNQYRKNSDSNSDTQQSVNKESSQNQNTFPNGSKVAIDYTKGQINISQVLTDFRSTILAINAPSDVADEVNLYLNLVEKESLKENPSRDIIVGNLKNASKISDAYIASALKKPSNVVEKWIETLFLQKINLKSNPNEVNPDFQLEFPKKAQERIDAQKLQTENQPIIQEQQEQPIQETSSEPIKVIEDDSETTEEIDVNSGFEIVDNKDSETVDTTIKPIETSETKKPLGKFDATCEADIRAKQLFSQAKKMPQDNKGDINALNLLNEALGKMAQDSSSNKNIKAAIHIERGKIFDSYDYVDYALRDYFEATKASDFNLKAQAFYKSGKIYDEFSEFYPAMDNYLSSVAYSAEAENTQAQTKVLSKIAGLYAKQFDSKNASQYGDLAIETAKDSNDSSLIADTYSKDAQNAQYVGDNDRAITSYKNALRVFSSSDETYEQTAYNYEQASIVMRRLGNIAKAEKLQSKANQYYQKAQLLRERLGEAS